MAAALPPQPGPHDLPSSAALEEVGDAANAPQEAALRAPGGPRRRLREKSGPTAQGHVAPQDVPVPEGVNDDIELAVVVDGYSTPH